MLFVREENIPLNCDGNTFTELIPGYASNKTHVTLPPEIAELLPVNLIAHYL